MIHSIVKNMIGGSKMNKLSIFFLISISIIFDILLRSIVLKYSFNIIIDKMNIDYQNIDIQTALLIIILFSSIIRN